MNDRSVVRLMARVSLGLGAAAWIAGCAATKDKGDMTAEMDETRKSEYNSSAYWLGEQPPREDEPAPAPRPRGECANYRPGVPTGMGLAEMFFPTGDRGSSGLLVQRVAPVQTRSGQPFAYEIHVTNITRGTLQNVVVSEESISNMSGVTSTPTASKGAVGLAEWNLGDLDPCETQVIRANATAGRTSPATECLGASFNNSLCSATQIVDPALALTKTATPEAMACDTINITYEVRNTGTGAAEGVRLHDTFASGLTTTDGKTAIDMDLGSIAAGQSKSVTVQAKASKAGRFESAATANASGGLSAESTRAATVIRQPALAVSVKCPDQVFVGREVTYEITVRNTGDGASANTMLSAGLPAGAQFVRASDGGNASSGGASWSLGTLAANANKTVTVVARPSTMGANRATASVQGTCAPAVSGNCETQMVGIPALLLDGVDSPDPIQVGETTTYTLVITNQGSAPLTGVKLVCTMDEDGTAEFVSAGGAGVGTARGRTITFTPIPRLEPKAKATYSVVVRAAKEGQSSLRAEASSNEITDPLIKAETTNFYR